MTNHFPADEPEDECGGWLAFCIIGFAACLLWLVLLAWVTRDLWLSAIR